MHHSHKFVSVQAGISSFIYSCHIKQLLYVHSWALHKYFNGDKYAHYAENFPACACNYIKFLCHTNNIHCLATSEQTIQDFIPTLIQQGDFTVNSYQTLNILQKWFFSVGTESWSRATWCYPNQADWVSSLIPFQEISQFNTMSWLLFIL